MKRLIPLTPRRLQKGVTLVELLIALLLGLLLTAGMIQVFVGNRATYEFNDSLSRIQENARFALDHMAYNARMGGYSGCLADVPIHNNLNVPLTDFKYNLENGVYGYDATGTTSDDDEYDVESPPGATWNEALPGDISPYVAAGSDVLVVRSVGGGAVSLVSPFTNAAQLFVDPAHNFLEGEILVVTDCQKASVFQVTGIDNGGENIVHSNNGSFIPGNSGPNWDDDQDYGLGAELARLQTFAFYVGDGPALFQHRLGAGGGMVQEELARGIEAMQIRYGVDSVNNDGAVDELVSAALITDWTTVVSVEISLLARATEEYGTETDTADYRLGGIVYNPNNDRRLRQVFSTSIGVRNRLP